MELPDLLEMERLACITLIHHIIMADKEVSEPELKHIDRLVSAFGEEVYRALLSECEEHLESEVSVKSLLSTITQQESRNIIYETVMECAFEEGITSPESNLVDWLSDNWNV